MCLSAWGVCLCVQGVCVYVGEVCVRSVCVYVGEVCEFSIELVQQFRLDLLCNTSKVCVC